MHILKKYEGADEEKADKAIEDTKKWLGEKWELIETELGRMTDNEENREQAAIMLSFAGVQGYPVGVLCDRYMGKQTHVQA